MKPALATVLLVAFTLHLVACSGDTDATPEETFAATYHGDIAPIFESACVSCHTEGESAPFSLTSFESARAWAAASVMAMEEGRMPPWLPDPHCQEFEGQREIPEGAVETLQTWIAEGMPEGEAPTGTPGETTLPLTSAFVPTHTGTMATPYMPDAELPDDYRCFVLDLTFEEDAYLMASRVVPDQKHLVHHVLVYAMSGVSLDEAIAADAETGNGYRCFGAPSPGGEEGSSLEDAGSLPLLVGSWVPGSQPRAVNPEISTRVPSGSRIIMQVHYNTLAGQLAADDTRFEIHVQSEPTPYLSVSRPILLPELFAAANDPAALNGHLFKNYTDQTIKVVRLGPHMHLLGSSFKGEVVRADGDRECAIEIPDWDFNWQEGYNLPKEAPIELAPGDGIYVECVYDNTAENQPSVNGVIQDPKDVYWGEGTTDEMCMLYLTMVEPFTPTADETAGCANSGDCLATCPEGRTDVECLLDCDQDLSCMGCGLMATVGCAAQCVLQLIELTDQDTFSNCFVNRMALGSSLDACLAAEAGAVYTDYAACVQGYLDTGGCHTGWQDCGIDVSGIEIVPEDAPPAEGP